MRLAIFLFLLWVNSFLFQYLMAQSSIAIIQQLEPQKQSAATIQTYWLQLVDNGMAQPVVVPIMIAKGKEEGPTLGLVAAIHGNELNGIPVIQRLFKEIDIQELRGTIIGIPVVNIPSFMRKKRRFIDGVDLNHIMPGKSDGNVSQVYAHRIIDRVIKHFEYLLDLHTASLGRINSYYIRADMDATKVRQMALLQNADIIVHNPPSDGTLRGAADEMGIPAITLEVGNPNTFQKRMIRSGIEGIHNVLVDLKMIPDEIVQAEKDSVICKRSYWIYTDKGGLLTVPVELRQKVEKGQLIATMRDIFGNLVKEYHAPEDGIVIGKSTNPVSQSGSRILHLGIVK